MCFMFVHDGIVISCSVRCAGCSPFVSTRLPNLLSSSPVHWLPHHLTSAGQRSPTTPGASNHRCPWGIRHFLHSQECWYARDFCP